MAFPFDLYVKMPDHLMGRLFGGGDDAPLRINLSLFLLSAFPYQSSSL